MMTPLKAIREKCLDCCCGQSTEVRLCTAIKCPLYEFRMGKNPNKKGRELTEDQREALAERLRKGREKKNNDA